MSKRLSVAEVKATFSDCIRKVENSEPIVITRHGKPIAALVRAEDLEHLRRLRERGPEGGLVSLAGGWDGSDEFVRLLERSSRLGRRDVEVLD